MIDQRNQILSLLQEGSSFLVISHENPDGDAVGSTLATTLMLRQMGKQAVAFNENAIPGYLQWLPGNECLVQSAVPQDFEVVCVLDCGAADRMGKIAEQVAQHPRVVNIDHHVTNQGFGQANLVAPQASSTCELLHGLAKFLDCELTPDIATNLYLGIYTDTNMFKNANSTPEAYAACGELVAAGADYMQVAKRVYIDTSAARITLLSRVLSTLQVEDNGRIAGIICTTEELRELQLGPEDLETFVEFPRAIVGVKAAYLLREQDGGHVKGSLRGNDQVDVAQVAKQYGGGGHQKAAGFRAEGQLAEVRVQLVEKLKEALEQKA